MNDQRRWPGREGKERVKEQRQDALLVTVQAFQLHLTHSKISKDKYTAERTKSNLGLEPGVLNVSTWAAEGCGLGLTALTSRAHCGTHAHTTRSGSRIYNRLAGSPPVGGGSDSAELLQAPA